MAKIQVEYTKVVTEDVEISDELLNKLIERKQRFGLRRDTDEDDEVFEQFMEVVNAHLMANRDNNVTEDIQVLLGYTIDGEGYDA